MDESGESAVYQKDALFTEPLNVIRFPVWDVLVQQRYENLRTFMLRHRDQQPRVTPRHFCLARFNRYGFLGLLDRDPLGSAWGWSIVEAYQVELISIGAADATERMIRLYPVLHRLVTRIAGGDNNATRGTLCTSFYGNAGKRADDSEPISEYLTLR